MNDVAIRVLNLSKCYQIYDAPRDRLKQFVVPKLCRAFPPLRKVFPTPRPLSSLSPQPTPQGAPTPHSLLPTYYREFWALKDVSFEIIKGESVAIIGRNGSGKSTLLQMICGTLSATNGAVETNGRIAALLELGAGFNPEFSGRENVYLNGALVGLSKEEIDNKFDDIAAFADIGQFIQQPIKTYSSGMVVRLAFSIQAQLDPDILIIDEALSVGDFFFQQKCFKHIRYLREKGTTLLFVSHDMGTVRDLCARTIYLHTGKSIYVGDTDHALKLYYRHGESGKTSNNLSAETDPSLDAQSPVVVDHVAVDAFIENAQWVAKDLSIPVSTAKIIAVSVVNSQNQPAFNCRMEEKLTFRVMLLVNANVPTHVSFGIKNKQDQLVTCMGTYLANAPEIKLDSLGHVVCDFEITFNLEAGGYSIHFGIGVLEGGGAEICYDQTPPIGPINITWDYQVEKPPFTGMVGLPVACSIASPDSL